MKYTRSILVAILLTLFTGIQPALAGNWAVATLDHLPDRVVAGEPVTVGFVIRQHGNNDRVLTGLDPVITARQVSHTGTFWTAFIAWIVDDQMAPISIQNERNLTIPLTEDAPGHYSGELVFPSPGVWQWTLSAFGPDQPMPPLTVHPWGASAETVTASTQDPVARGQALFVAKGCVVCHEHSAVLGETYASTSYSRPGLTHYRGDPAFLRAWLHDPASVSPDTPMPDLDLSDTEIEALIAFLNAETPSASNP